MLNRIGQFFKKHSEAIIVAAVLGLISLPFTVGKDAVSSILESNHRHSQAVRASAEQFTRSLEILDGELQQKDGHDAVVDAQKLLKQIDSHSFDAFLSPDPIPQTQEIRLLNDEVSILRDGLSTYVLVMSDRRDSEPAKRCEWLAPYFIERTVTVLASRMRSNIDRGLYGHD
jgi:hypothetical protein